jgi:predicted permease
MGWTEVLGATATATGKIVLLVALGAVLERREVLDSAARSYFNRIVCLVMVPSILFVASIVPFAPANMSRLVPLVLSCLVTITAGNLIGRLFALCMPTRTAATATLTVCTCGNVGAIPMLLMKSLCSNPQVSFYGTRGCDVPESYPAIFMLPMNILFWTWAYNLLQVPDLLDDEPSDHDDMELTLPTANGQHELQSAPGRVQLAGSGERVAATTLNVLHGSSTPADPPPPQATMQRPSSQVFGEPTPPTADVENPSTTNEPIQNASVCPTQAFYSQSMAMRGAGPVTGMKKSKSQVWEKDDRVTVLSAAQKTSAGPPAGTVKDAVTFGQFDSIDTVGRFDAQTTAEILAAPPNLQTARTGSSRCHACLRKAKQLAMMPPNMAMLLAIVLGMSPIRELFVTDEPPVAGKDAPQPPLAVLMQTLWALGSGANPCLMLLLGASLSETYRVTVAQVRPSHS